jgi:hypothetical protein
VARGGAAAATTLTWQQLEGLLLRAITHEELGVRSLAVECIALYSLLLPSQVMLRKAVLLLHGLFLRDCAAVAAAAAKGLADISMVWGPGSFMEAVAATPWKTATAAAGGCGGGFALGLGAGGGAESSSIGISLQQQEQGQMGGEGAEGGAGACGDGSGNTEGCFGAGAAGDEDGGQGLGILELLLLKVSVLLVQAESGGEAGGRQRGRVGSRYVGYNTAAILCLRKT